VGEGLQRRRRQSSRSKRRSHAADAFGTRAPRLHVPLAAVAALARVQGAVAALRGRIPDLEADAVRYLHDDYVVDNSKLRAAGHRLLYPDFAESMRDLGRRWRKEAADPVARKAAVG
jgi:hypothetical protein